MWFRKRPLRAPLLGLVMAVMGVFWACQVSQDGGHTYLNIQVDSSFTKYDIVQIVVVDSAAGTRDTIFNQHLSSVSEVSKIQVENYQGQKVNIVITGFMHGQAVYQEVRQYDGQSPTNTVTVVVDSVAPVDSVHASPHSLTLKKGGSSAEISSSVLPSKVSQAVTWISTAPGVAAVQSKSGDATHALVSPVAVGQARIIVASQKDPTKTDTVFVTVADSGTSSSNANLSALTISAGTLNNPAFDSTKRVSGASVANSVTATTVTATVADTTARLTINGTATASGVASASIPLTVGVDSIFIVVTAPDSTQKTYAIGITRAPPNASSNATLSALTISAGTLNSPAFDPAKRVSGASVANSVSSTTVTATVADTTARLTINGTATASGAASAPISLAVGVDSIFVVVTAPDSTQKTYAMGITRAAPNASSNANLSALAISAGTLNNPAFSSTSRVSGTSVANSVSSTTVTATVADTTARLTINGNAATSGAASAAIPLAVGVDSIFVVVTAQDATQKTYVIAVTRAASSNANLSALTISAGTLNNPAFSSTSRVSGASVANSASSTTVTATVADTTARVTINGTAATSGAASAAIPLAVGVDSIFVVVTAQDGTKNTYAIGITRAKSSNANLSALTTSAGALNNPAFDPAKRVSGEIVANSVSSITVTATVADTTARLTVNGTTTASGVASAAIPLAVGVDSIFVVVTAQDGTTNTYAIGMTRSASSDASLATLTVTPGALSPALTAGVTSYAVNYTTDSTISVKATPTQAGATMTWNGGSLSAGVATTPVKVNYGATPFTLIVTAPDGVTKTTYTVTVNRVDNIPPNAPVLTAMPSRVYVSNPTWSWGSGGNGGSGNYRYKFDNTDLTTGATTVAGTSIAPVISDGPHTLYVQEEDAAGNWSTSGSATTIVMFGPASWYKFNSGDYTDYGFNKNNGTTPVALSLVPSPRGTTNGAASFDGTTYLNLGTPTYPTANSNITLTCWIKVDTSNSAGYAFWGQLLISAGGSGGGSLGVVSLGVNDSTSSPPFFGISLMQPFPRIHGPISREPLTALTSGYMSMALSCPPSPFPIRRLSRTAG